MPRDGDFVRAWAGSRRSNWGLRYWTGARDRGRDLEISLAGARRDRPNSRPRAQGRIAPGCDADLIVFDPRQPSQSSGPPAPAPSGHTVPGWYSRRRAPDFRAGRSCTRREFQGGRWADGSGDPRRLIDLAAARVAAGARRVGRILCAEAQPACGRGAVFIEASTPIMGNGWTGGKPPPARPGSGYDCASSARYPGAIRLSPSIPPLPGNHQPPARSMRRSCRRTPRDRRALRTLDSLRGAVGALALAGHTENEFAVASDAPLRTCGSRSIPRRRGAAALWARPRTGRKSQRRGAPSSRRGGARGVPLPRAISSQRAVN